MEAFSLSLGRAFPTVNLGRTIQPRRAKVSGSTRPITSCSAGAFIGLLLGLRSLALRRPAAGKPLARRSRCRAKQPKPEVELEEPQNAELNMVPQSFLPTNPVNGWILLGDLLTSGVAAPLLAVFYMRVGVLRPDWFVNIVDAERDFIFPEFAHGIFFFLCFCYGGLAIGSFEADAVDSENLFKTIQRTVFSGAVTAWLATVVRSLLFVTGSLEGAYELAGYHVPLSHTLPSYPDFFIDLLFEVFLIVAWRFTAAVILAESPVPERENTRVDGRLLLGDLMVAGFIVPTMVIEVFFKTQTYTPLWTVFWDVSDYGIWKPILAHGSILAVCWLVGAYVAGAYSKDAMEPIDLPLILKRLWTAGTVAAVLLGASTVLTANLESQSGFLTAFAADVTMQKQFFDFVTDIVFAALCLTTWRLYFAGYI